MRKYQVIWAQIKQLPPDGVVTIKCHKDRVLTIKQMVMNEKYKETKGLRAMGIPTVLRLRMTTRPAPEKDRVFLDFRATKASSHFI